MATTPVTASLTTASSFSILCRRPGPPHNSLKPPTFLAPELAACFRIFRPTTSSYTASLSLRVRASKPEREGDPSTLASNPNSTTISSFQEDASYLWKLALGSVIGAAIIKYGCIVFPDITRPDIVQALLMIFAPAVASVILLILGSRRE